MRQLEFTRVPTTIPATKKALRRPSPIARVASASSCLFGAEIAEALGLTLERGVRTRFRTANSGFEAFGHEVEIGVLGVATNAMVYFFPDPMIDKNVLGRTGWLDRVRLGLVHHDSKAYLAPYD